MLLLVFVFVFFFFSNKKWFYLTGLNTYHHPGAGINGIVFP